DRRLVHPADVLKDAQVVRVDGALAALVRVQRNVDARAATLAGDAVQGAGPGADPLEIARVRLVVGVAGLPVVHAQGVGRRGDDQVRRRGVGALDETGAVAAHDPRVDVFVNDLGDVTRLRSIGAAI